MVSIHGTDFQKNRISLLGLIVINGLAESYCVSVTDQIEMYGFVGLASDMQRNGFLSCLTTKKEKLNKKEDVLLQVTLFATYF